MILLRANQELRQTFDRLIETMKVQVKWNGIFAVIDNYIILQGEVRSLFFHFDSRKVVTNIIDIPVKEEDVQETANNVQVRNVINMILYVFGKWGTINGLKVEKNYAQLNQLFNGILRELQVEPQYDMERFRFYKNGIQVTYEDVIQFALEHVDEEIEQQEEEAGGLWHKIVWKKEQCEFTHVETTLEERLKGRLGNNFYSVGYLCPVCGEKMHMVVYPKGKEFKIETEEGSVLLARAATCGNCSGFYTPRPDKLFSEGDVYSLQFEGDQKAYEDYLELMGERGERVSNHNFNRFVDPVAAKENEEKIEDEEQTKELEEFCGDLSGHTEEEIARMRARMEEGFYSDTGIIRLEKKIQEFYQEKDGTQKKIDVTQNVDNTDNINNTEEDSDKGAMRHSSKLGQQAAKQVESYQQQMEEIPRAKQLEESENQQLQSQPQTQNQSETQTKTDAEEEINQEEQQKLQEKYEAKLKVSDRFSQRQLLALKDQLQKDSALAMETKRKYIEQVDRQLQREQMEKIEQKVAAVEGKPYMLMKRVWDEVRQQELPESQKATLLQPLRDWMQVQGEREVQELMQKMPLHMNRERYRLFSEKLHSYEGINLTPYEEKLKSVRELAERQEVEDLVKRARKITKEDYQGLAKRLSEGDFLPELVLPYQEKIEEKIRTLDADEIAKICPNPMDMTFEEGLDAYGKIESGDFLPELKEDALRMLKKRLSKIKTDECELLVKKLQGQFDEAKIVANEKHHFYPARKVLLEQVTPEETAVIDFAVASYAAGIGLFEYPIFVVDTSRNGSGKEGMILTPDHLYYSTMLTSYGISVFAIEKVTASTGILNRGLYIHRSNGEKLKIPYAVEHKQLIAYAGVLNEFVHYLQEKPQSRRVDYLAKEKHDTICCFRCGHVYKGGNTCPQCGYKNNE